MRSYGRTRMSSINISHPSVTQSMNMEIGNVGGGFKCRLVLPLTKEEEEVEDLLYPMAEA